MPVRNIAAAEGGGSGFPVRPLSNLSCRRNDGSNSSTADQATIPSRLATGFGASSEEIHRVGDARRVEAPGAGLSQRVGWPGSLEDMWAILLATPRLRA